jgi:hypothetical protein
MTRFHWNSKDVREDKDITSDVNLSAVSGSSPEVTHSGEWTTSRRELWCFYLYSIVRFSPFYFTSSPILYYPLKGNNGLAGYRFGPSQFQNFLHSAGYDLSQPPFTKPCGRGSTCVLPFMGRVRSSSSFFHLSLLRYSSMSPRFYIYYW